MILPQTVKVRISRESKYYEQFGYLKTKQGSFLVVRVEHLPKLSKANVLVVCDDCNEFRMVEYRNLHQGGKYCKSCSGKRTIKNACTYPNPRASGSKHGNYNPNKSRFDSFKNRVRGLTKTTYNNCKEQINPLNLIRTPSGVHGGYQLDHIISIKRGFEEGISPEILASKENLQMITWEQNLERRKLDRDLNNRNTLKEK
jgi:hypothetical protein